MKAPGTLSDEEQARFSAQMLSLVRGFYGEDAHYGLAVAKFVPAQREAGMGLAVYTSGSTPDPKQLASLFTLAAEYMHKAEVRRLAVDDGEPDSPKN